jgi:hypothetical protein
MAGITNRPEELEEANQQRVEQRKDELPDIEAVNRPRKDHPVDKDRAADPSERGRSSDASGGRGPEQTGR